MTTSTPAPERAKPRPLERHLAAFDAFNCGASTNAPSWLRALRTSGISRLAELGLPASDLDEWRFTNPALLAQFPFVPANTPVPGRLRESDVESFVPSGLKTHRLVFLDGYLVPEMSACGPIPPGAAIGSLAQAARKQPLVLESQLGRAAGLENDAFSALNTAFLQDGAFIFVPAHQCLETPIHLLFLASANGAVNQPRTLVLVGPHARLNIIEDYVSLGDTAAFTNAVTEVFAEEGSQIEHLKVQRENMSALHVGTIEFRQRRGSRVHTHSISIGAKLARHNIHLRLEQAGCESLLNGLYLADEEQVADHHTIADHRAPHCASHEFLHGILGGRAKGVFNGRIFVRQDAQKTDARQTNRNLLLSEEATVNATPQLEIFADDVKCTHGATVGQLDEAALFYLRSRGIGEELARQMLIRAFASDVVNRIASEPARAWLEHLLAACLSRSLEPQSANSKPLSSGETNHV